MRRKMVIIGVVISIIVLFVFYLLTPVFLIKNTLEIRWYKTYGGEGIDLSMSLLQTTDGGFALAGSTISASTGGIDMWLVKTDVNGVAQWNKTYGGIGEDGAFSLIQTTDGGYMLAGSTSSAGAGRLDMWLVKTDVNGVAQWNKTYGRAGWEMAWVLLQTDDGGFALAGSTNSTGTGKHEMWLIKTDVNGVAQWNKTYGGTGEFGVAAFQNINGDYVLACNNLSEDTFFFDTFVIKTDVNGIPQWNQTYAGLFFLQFLGLGGPALIETMDGGIALVGLTFNLDTLETVIIKTDVNGTIQWDKTVKGVEKEIRIGSSLLQTTNGEFIIAGSVLTIFGDIGDIINSDIWMGKLVVRTNQLTRLEILPIVIAICFKTKKRNRTEKKYKNIISKTSPIMR